MKKITWNEFVMAMRNFNKEHNHTHKGNEKVLKGVVVFTEDNFNKPYTVTQRSYQTTSDQKMFLPNQLSNSVFANCLDGSDDGVRLDWYMYDENPWKVEYCYLIEE